MFEKEEQELALLRNRLEQEPLPLEKADGVILQGMERAKREKQQSRLKRKRTFWTFAAAAVLILAFTASIRVSPAFANAVAAIPGMEKFVELIEQDKGLGSILENDYYQPIGASQTQGNHTLTIDGVILDESGMNVYYTIESSQSLEDIQVKNTELMNKEASPTGAISYGSQHSGKSPNLYSDHVNFHFENSQTFEDLTFDFELEILVSGQDTVFSVPFTVPENVKPSLAYSLEQEVQIDGQKFTVDEIVIHPLRTEVTISLNPANSMKILQFEDMRLEDENGEVWGSILNGLTSTGGNDGQSTTYLLQSNYFEQPEGLYLRINSVQALPNDEAYIVFDTEKNELISGPKDGRFTMENATKKEATFVLTGTQDEEHHYGLEKSITDAEGKELYPSSGSTSPRENETVQTIEFETTDYTNPLRLELFAYPNRIEGDVKVKLGQPLE